jgi:hypothetical protein
MYISPRSGPVGTLHVGLRGATIEKYFNMYLILFVFCSSALGRGDEQDFFCADLQVVLVVELRSGGVLAEPDGAPSHRIFY